jgi:hypothetical protein
MVSVCVCWKGRRTRFHVIDTEKTKVNSVNYMKLLPLTTDFSQTVEICTPREDDECTFFSRMSESHLVQA